MQDYDDSINLLEELDNVSKIHFLQRDDIDGLMLEFGKRIIATMHIERVNVWLFNAEKDALISIGEYDIRTRSFGKDSVLTRTDFPEYFEALSENRIIVAPNVYSSPHTAEFTEKYSRPNNIISLMDVPLRIAGELVGVICFEKCGEKERWFTEKDQAFALSVSLVLASNLEARHRRAAQHKLAQALAEKELLVQEINHRVKNNFSILISLLRLSRRQGRSNTDAILEEYEQRIFSMLKIQELLYQTKNYTSVNLPDYVKELVAEFRSSHPEIAPSIKTSIEAGEFHIPSRTAINLGLITTEVFLNSVKHAWGKTDSYALDISIQEQAGKYKLSIGGNGNRFDFEEGLKNSSMGLHLVKSLSEDLDIELKFPSKTNPWYEFYFTRA